MKTKLVLATQNEGKIKEIRELLAGHVDVIGLPPSLQKEELPEHGETLEANALEKAQFVFEKTGMFCLADDTGLEVEALNGEPGVYSARYAGAEKSADANMNKLLQALDAAENRSARFRTALALKGAGVEEVFFGIVEGRISEQRSGVEGFGYDPIFIPEGATETFAAMSSAEKSAISHRGRALQALLGYLREHSLD